uniref:Uncharacterized protein n=1 Tax=viral metagenome TaxID=1070528 RepID=A0A6C0H5G6_9ZZZZ
MNNNLQIDTFLNDIKNIVIDLSLKSSKLSADEIKKKIAKQFFNSNHILENEIRLNVITKLIDDIKTEIIGLFINGYLDVIKKDIINAIINDINKDNAIINKTELLKNIDSSSSWFIKEIASYIYNNNLSLNSFDTNNQEDITIPIYKYNSSDILIENHSTNNDVTTENHDTIILSNSTENHYIIKLDDVPIDNHDTIKLEDVPTDNHKHIPTIDIDGIGHIHRGPTGPTGAHGLIGAPGLTGATGPGLGHLKDDYISTMTESNNLKTLLNEFGRYDYIHPITLFNEKYYPSFIKRKKKYSLELRKWNSKCKLVLGNIDYHINLISLLNNLENDYCIYDNKLILKQTINVLDNFTENH